MVNHKEILRLKSLGLTHCEIAEGADCGRNTVTRTLARAREHGLSWQQAQSMTRQEVTQRLFPAEERGSVGNRASCFEEEKLFLLPLPPQPFELAFGKPPLSNTTTTSPWNA